jgi:hypothetical protein
MYNSVDEKDTVEEDLLKYGHEFFLSVYILGRNIG